jgi:hypothetical protein
MGPEKSDAWEGRPSIEREIFPLSFALHWWTGIPWISGIWVRGSLLDSRFISGLFRAP